MSDKHRIIDLQKQVKLARGALERIKYGTTRPEVVAEDALDEMRRLDAKYPLQHLVGHASK